METPEHEELVNATDFFFPSVKNPLFFGSSARGPSTVVGRVAARPGVVDCSPDAPLAALIFAIHVFISS